MGRGPLTLRRARALRSAGIGPYARQDGYDDPDAAEDEDGED